jgi:hypothetical protein
MKSDISFLSDKIVFQTVTIYAKRKNNTQSSYYLMVACCYLFYPNTLHFYTIECTKNVLS